jgi:hypothetical protein
VVDARLPVGGFVVVSRADTVSRIAESSAYLESGSHDDVRVRLGPNFGPGDQVRVVVHRDRFDDQTFSDADDVPYRLNGSVVSADARVPADGTTTPTASASPPFPTTASNGTASTTPSASTRVPGFGPVATVAALLALLAAALGRVRRPRPGGEEP